MLEPDYKNSFETNEQADHSFPKIIIEREKVLYKYLRQI